jgi:glycogen operon protein
VVALRDRQVKNFLTVLMLSVGTPMLLMGDEVRRSQNGNNNAYCLDDPVNWFDWRMTERHSGLRRFVQKLAAFRQGRNVVDESRRYSLNELLQWAHVDWHGVALGRPDWSDHSHSLAFTAGTPRWPFILHAMFNAYREPLTFELPRGSAGALGWRRYVDTALPSPDDFYSLDNAVPIVDATYCVQPHSCAVLAAPRPLAAASTAAQAE